MRPIQKILCALDLSSHSGFVAEYAAGLGRAFGAEVIILYVAPVFSQYRSLTTSLEPIEKISKEIRAGAEKKLHELETAYFGETSKKSLVAQGDASDEIVRAATEEDADLIVMGTHGYTGMDRIIFGSVAEKVVKSSPVPVLTVRPSASV